mmetsp:Transcript_21921/g.37606  ORF Transcript_21921/g.37606 Transcript_21921/m.37606 type:complete len:84 (+) Transcript_21921:47-298(+)
MRSNQRIKQNLAQQFQSLLHPPRNKQLQNVNKQLLVILGHLESNAEISVLELLKNATNVQGTALHAIGTEARYKASTYPNVRK